MKRLLATAFAAVTFCAQALALNAPDTAVVTGPNFQQIPATQMMVTPSGGMQTTLGQALASSGGCTTNCTIQTLTVPTALNVTGTSNTAGINDTAGINTTAAFNGWGPKFGLTPNGTTLTFGGTTNAVGDVLTLNDGCATHSKIAVSAVTGGAINSSSGYNVVQQGSCLVSPTGTVHVLSSTGTDTSATFTTAWAPGTGGINFITGTLQNNNGNTIIDACSTHVFAGTESVFIGCATGGNVGSGSFNVAVGLNAMGIGGTGCPVIYVGASTVLGTDALRNTCGNSQIVAVGSSALHNYNQTGTSGNLYGWGITAVGTSSMVNWNGAVATPFMTALGDSSCAGQTGSSFSLGTCVGATTGGALIDATNFLIIGGGKANNGHLGTGNATFAHGNGVILIGSGRNTVDTPTATQNDYINFENIWTVTGTGNAATSASTIAGSLNVVGTLSQNGTPIGAGGYSGVYGIAQSTPIAPTNGGTGYTVGDTLTVTDGCSPSAVLTVRTAPAGVIGTLIIASPGSCTAPTAGALATTGGTGTGATVTPVYGPLAAGLLVPPTTGNAENFWVGNVGPAAGYTGVNSVLVGPRIALTLTGASNFNTAMGYGACGGLSGGALTMTSVSCYGDGAGRGLQGTVSVTNIDVFGSGALVSQAQATRSIAAFGANSLGNLNTSVAPANLAAFGPSACNGASAATFNNGACLGPLTGAALTSAANFLIAGPSVGRVNATSGSNFMVLGTTSACDLPSLGASNYIGLCAGGAAVFSVAGSNTPATSQTTIAGELFSGGGTVLATATTTGFLHLPFVAAAPTGTPATVGGDACVVNTATQTLNCYIGAAWFHTTLSSGAG